MQARALGNFTIGRAGFGDVCLARSGWRNVAGREVERCLRAGLDLGIALVDLADEDAARQLASETVRDMRLRDRVVLACRLADLPVREGIPDRDTLPERLPAAYVVHRVESILRATKLDVLPLVQLPLRSTWTSSTAWPELAGTCARLVREGKVLHWGALVGANDPDVVALACEVWLDTAHVTYSLCDRTAEPLFEPPKPDDTTADDTAPAESPPSSTSSGLLVTSGPMLDMVAAMLASPVDTGFDPAALLAAANEPDPTTTAQPKPKAKANRTPRAILFASRVLAGGTLAGTFAPGMKLAVADDRRTIDDTMLATIAERIAQLAPLVRQPPPAAAATAAAREIADRTPRPDDVEARTVAELALRFVLDRGAIALPRIHRAEHLPEMLAATYAKPLSAGLRERLDESFPPPKSSSENTKSASENAAD